MHRRSKNPVFALFTAPTITVLQRPVSQFHSALGKIVPHIGTLHDLIIEIWTSFRSISCLLRSCRLVSLAEAYSRPDIIHCEFASCHSSKSLAALQSGISGLHQTYPSSVDQSMIHPALLLLCHPASSAIELFLTNGTQLVYLE